MAELSAEKEFIESQGGKQVSHYPKSISIGIRLIDSIVDYLTRRRKRSVAIKYRNMNEEVNQRLNILTTKLSQLLKEKGYKTLPVPSAKKIDEQKLAAIFSHKLAAHQAGLGWIGKSCLLITPEAGPRLRWSTVLTDAPLEVTGGPLPDQCRDCTKCVDICPAKAFTGRSFHEDEPREAHFDAEKCMNYMIKDRFCGLYVYICPFGKKEI